MLSLVACYREYDLNWVPTPITREVSCCITEQQVHGVIYKALLKRNWNIIDKTDNSFTTKIRCDDKDINIYITNTDKNYTIAVEDNIPDVYNYGYCIESHRNKMNKYIKIYLKKYLKKAMARSANKELKG